MTSWTAKKLVDITTKIGSGATPKGGKNAYKSEGLSLIRSMNIHDLSFKAKDLALIDEEQASKLDNVTVEQGDVLLNITGASVARCCVIPDDYLPARVNQHVSIIRPISKIIDSHFLAYLLVSHFYKSRLLADGDKGATREALTKKQLQEFEIHYPPIEHQKEIVASLDKTFADIEQARANTEKNLQNARELFDSYLQQVFSERGEGWKTVKVSDIAELISGQHIAAKDYNSDGKGIGYLTGPSDFGRMSPTVTKWTEHPKKTALSGDILITVKGSGVGKINTMVDPELAISRQLMAIRVDAEISQLLYWVLYLNYEYFQSLANGAAIPGISRIDVLNLEFSLPTKNQEAVISNIELVQQKVYELEKIYNQKLAALDELKQSLLQQAFTGQLTQG
ncbi:TPA: restriction endonuclease subunit S [Vibrio parahaemolyticus]|nr:restriction endonuclease subunit S [Vibrio parahaemolyticus]